MQNSNWRSSSRIDSPLATETQPAQTQNKLQARRLHGVDPYTYLVDVLQRVQIQPAKRVVELTPRLWKQHFGDHPLRSDIDRALPKTAPLSAAGPPAAVAPA